ncbi:unnamed protein product [Urochloa humidicola]
MVLRSSASDLSSRSPMRPPMRLLLLAGSRRCFSHRADAQFPVASSSSHRPWRWRLDAAFRAVRNPSSTDLSLPNPAAASTVLGQGGGGHGYSVQSHRSPSASYSKCRSPWICRHRLLLAAKPKPTPSLHPSTGVSVLRPLPAVEWLTPSIPLLWAQANLKQFYYGRISTLRKSHLVPFIQGRHGVFDPFKASGIKWSRDTHRIASGANDKRVPQNSINVCHQ